MEEFKYLGVLFTIEERMEECEIDKQISAAAAVMQSLYRSVVVKRELSRNGQSTFLPSSMVMNFGL